MGDFITPIFYASHIITSVMPNGSHVNVAF
jgi:hypothetical protein